MPIKRYTQDEIDQKVQEAEKEDPDADPLEDDETPEDEELEDKGKKQPDNETPDDEESDEEDDEPEDEKSEDDDEEDDTPEDEKSDKKDLPDTEERLKHSSNEAKILHNKTQKFSEAVLNAKNLPEPTEEELKAKYSNWDLMSETEQMLAKENYKNSRRFEMVEEVALASKKLDEWAGTVDKFLITASTKKEYAGLDGKEDRFKKYCMKESRVNVDFDVLVNAFLNVETTFRKPRQKGSLFNRAGGDKKNDTQKKQTGLDAEQIKKLRINKPRLYQKMVREGKIKIEI